MGVTNHLLARMILQIGIQSFILSENDWGEQSPLEGLLWFHANIIRRSLDPCALSLSSGLFAKRAEGGYCQDVPGRKLGSRLGSVGEKKYSVCPFVLVISWWFQHI